jgi:WD40 repeat protein
VHLHQHVGKASETTTAWPGMPTGWSFAFSPDGKTLLTGPTVPDRHEVCAWDTATGKPRGEPLPHPAAVSVIVFSPDCKHCATVVGSAVRVWDVEKRRLVAGPLPTAAQPPQLAFSSDGRVLLAWAGTVTTPGPGGSRLITPGRHAWMWEAATGEPIGGALTHAAEITTAVFSPTGEVVLVGNLNRCPRPFVIPAGDFQAWDLRTGKLGPRLRHARAVRDLAFRPDGRYLATLDLDGSRLWRTDTWKEVADTPPSRIPFTDTVTLAFDEDRRTIITASSAGGYRRWQPPYPIGGSAAQLRRELEVRTGLALEEGVALPLNAEEWEQRRQQAPGP